MNSCSHINYILHSSLARSIYNNNDYDNNTSLVTEIQDKVHYH